MGGLPRLSVLEGLRDSAIARIVRRALHIPTPRHLAPVRVVDVLWVFPASLGDSQELFVARRVLTPSHGGAPCAATELTMH